MAKYEIMIIVDPKEDLKTVEALAKDVFGDGMKKFAKMDKTELAYPINKTTTAQYVLIDAELDGEQIKEFTRKVNISKTIWRQLAINLDSERQMDSWENMKKFEEFKKKKAAERAANPRFDSRRPRPEYKKPEAR